MKYILIALALFLVPTVYAQEITDEQVVQEQVEVKEPFHKEGEPSVLSGKQKEYASDIPREQLDELVKIRLLLELIYKKL